MRHRHTLVRLATGLVILVLGASLSGCYDDEAQNEAPVGQTERNETVTAANLAIVSDNEGNGVLVGTLVADDGVEDRLVDVRVEDGDGEPVEVSFPRGPVTIPEAEPVRLGDDPAVLVSTERLRQGFRAPVTLEFADSDPVSTTVTVEPQTDPYAEIEIPTPAG